MTTTILLTRHGQTESNVTGFYMGWSDEDLNQVGYTQAHRLSSRLASLPIASVYTSPLRRAYTTAAIVAEPHKFEPKVLDDLIEIGQGDWQGLHIGEIKRRWPELWQQSRIDPSELTMPNGESIRQVTERAIRAFETVVKANQGKQTVIVTLAGEVTEQKKELESVKSSGKDIFGEKSKELQTAIDKTKAQIDESVIALYGLTSEEIQQIERIAGGR